MIFSFKLRIEKWKNKIIGDPLNFSLEQRLFNILTLLNGILNIFGTFWVVGIDYFYWILGLNTISGFLLIFFYSLSRFYNTYKSLFWPLNLLLLLYLSVDWFFNAGSLGGNQYYFLTAIVISITLINKERPYFVFGIYGFVVFFLFYIEYYFPDLILGEMKRNERITDMGANFLFSILLTGYLVYILKMNLEEERHKSDRLLKAILPEKVANELKTTLKVKPLKYESASVLFTDFTGFTKIAEKIPAEELVDKLDFCFRAFDEIIERNHLLRIKTIGDSYMAVAGLPNENPDHAKMAVRAGLEIRDFIQTHKNKQEDNGHLFWDIRVGIHSGSLVAGVIGHTKFAYDIWGDTVNTASRIESVCTPGCVNVSKEIFEATKDFFEFRTRGKIEVKSKGPIDIFFVDWKLEN